MDIIINAAKPCSFNCKNCYLKFNDFAKINDVLNLTELNKEFRQFIDTLPTDEEHTIHYFYMEINKHSSKYLIDFNHLVLDMFRYTKLKKIPAHMSMKYADNSSINNSMFIYECEQQPFDALEISMGIDEHLIHDPIKIPIMNYAKRLILNFTVTNKMVESGSLADVNRMLNSIYDTAKIFRIIFGKPISMRIGLEKPYTISKELRHAVAATIFNMQTEINTPEMFDSMYNVMCMTNDLILNDACQGVMALTPDYDRFILSRCPYQLTVNSCKDCGFLK